MAKGNGHYKEEYVKMEKLLKDQKDDEDVIGYTAHTDMIKRVGIYHLEGVNQVILNTLDLIPKLTNRNVLQFTIGATEARVPADGGFDINDISTWVVEGGLKARWYTIKQYFDGLIVLATTDVSTLQNGILEQLNNYFLQRYTCDEYIKLPAYYKRPADSIDAGMVVIYLAYVLKGSERADTVKSTEDWIKESMRYASPLQRITNPSQSYESLLKLQQRSTYAAKLLVHNGVETYTQLADALKEHTKQVINDIEKKSTKKIIKFTIGQTFARQHKRFQFDPLTFETWRLDGGLNGRWTNFYRPEGYDGLIALCAITRDTIPSGIKKTFKWMDQIECAKALEQRLIQYFMLEELDPRVANTSFHTGSKAGSAQAGVVYLAYMLSDIPQNSEYFGNNYVSY